MIILGGVTIKKRKIMYIVESMGGGVLTYLAQLCNNIDSKYEIVILYGMRDQTPNNLNEFFPDDVTLIISKYLKRNISIKNDYKAFEEIKKTVYQLRPDIVHLNSSKAGAIGRLVKLFNFVKFKNISFLYTPHGYSFQMKDCSVLKIFFYFIIEFLLGKLNTKTVACGKGEYNLARKISKNCIYINNCVDYNKLNQNYHLDLKANKTFYTVGRITNQKNPKMFNEIALHNPEINFVWIGDGPNRDLLSAKNIFVTGWITQKQMMNLVREFNFFVLCSKWEGLPLSLLEAMSMGKICFVSNITGCKEVIEDGVNGFIFDTVKNINSKIENVNEIKLKEISDLSMKTIKDNYSISRFIDQYDRMYSSL